MRVPDLRGAVPDEHVAVGREAFVERSLGPAEERQIAEEAVAFDHARIFTARRRPFNSGRKALSATRATASSTASFRSRGDPGVRESPVGMDVPPISSPRLELRSMSPAFLQALLAGRRDEATRILGAPVPDAFPDAHDTGFLRLRLGQMEQEPERACWLRALVLPGAEPVMVGHAGFHGPPGVNGPKLPDALELGYTVFPAHRGRGYATEAAQALMAWAETEHGVDHFVASVAPENDPSLAIVRKLGFVQTGEQWDEEDGLELVFERR
jgi:[ribosomal protein S5]-alanine N-acetyltransferase